MRAHVARRSAVVGAGNTGSGEPINIISASTSPKARSLRRFGDARTADGSRTAVERRFHVNDTHRNVALKLHGGRR
jgi:hypothetical protein